MFEYDPENPREFDGFYSTVEDGDTWSERTVKRELARHGLSYDDLLTELNPLPGGRWYAEVVLSWLGY